jgi:hypothetical protein
VSLSTGTGFWLPGTTIRSGWGTVSGVCVGTTVRPRSLRTGSMLPATKCTCASGQRLMISYGPTRSSAVKSGYST